MGRIDRRTTAKSIARLVIAEIKFAAWPLQQRARYPVGDDVDDAADRAAAIQQGRRSFQDFQLSRHQRIDTNRVIVT